MSFTVIEGVTVRMLRVPRLTLLARAGLAATRFAAVFTGAFATLALLLFVFFVAIRQSSWLPRHSVATAVRGLTLNR